MTFAAITAEAAPYGAIIRDIVGMALAAIVAAALAFLVWAALIRKRREPAEEQASTTVTVDNRPATNAQAVALLEAKVAELERLNEALELYRKEMEAAKALPAPVVDWLEIRAVSVERGQYEHPDETIVRYVDASGTLETEYYTTTPETHAALCEEFREAIKRRSKNPIPRTQTKEVENA